MELKLQRKVVSPNHREEDLIVTLSATFPGVTDDDLRERLAAGVSDALDLLFHELTYDQQAHGRFDDPDIYGFLTAHQFFIHMDSDFVIWNDELLVRKTPHYQVAGTLPLVEFRQKFLDTLMNRKFWYNTRQADQNVGVWNLEAEVFRDSNTY